jgi:hypothetical protein
MDREGMKYSIVTFSGNVLPAVWPVKSDTEDGAMEEAKAMYKERLSVVPGLLIDWEAGKVLRLLVNQMGENAKIYDNAGELFGIATTAEHFEQIAEARDAAEMKIQQDMEQEANGD